MAKMVLNNAFILIHGYNIGTMCRAGTFELGCEIVDTTTFGELTKTKLPGVLDAKVSLEGLWEAVNVGTFDAGIFASIGTESDMIAHVAPEGGTVGNQSYFYEVESSKYNWLGAHGQAAPFTFEAEGNTQMRSGNLLYNGQVADGTSYGTAAQLGSVTGDQYIYCAMNVYWDNATTLDVTIESDDAAGFVSPVTRATFPQISGADSKIVSTAGAITDDWWRVKFVSVGVRFDVAVSMGIA